MKYQRILEHVTSQPWAIRAEKMGEIMEVLEFRASGGRFSAEELQARIGNGAERQAPSRTGVVAIIPIHGTIAHRMGGIESSSGGTSLEQINNMIDAVAADPNIGSILYDFNTPGGSVMGADETAAKMFALRGIKRQVAMVNGECCSLGYYLASQADEIVSIPSGETGSIGVVWPHIDRSENLAKEGIKVTVFKAGKYKWAGNPYEPMPDDFAERRQARVDTAYDQFVKAVARGRGVTPAAVRAGYGEGDVLVGKAAKEAGLVDRIASFDETLARLTGRKSSAGMRAAAYGDDVKASFHSEEETLDETEARMATPKAAQVEVAPARKSSWSGF